jgi:hypothetical protein
VADEAIDFAATEAGLDFQPASQPVEFQPAAAQQPQQPDLSDPAGAVFPGIHWQKPLISIAPRTAAALMPALKLVPNQQVREGIAEGAANLFNSATTPESIALGFVAALQPEIGVGVISGLMAKEAGSKLGEASVAAQLGEVKQAARLATEGAGAALFAAAGPLSMAHAALRESGTKLATEAVPETTPTIDLEVPPVITPEQPPVIPQTAEANATQTLGILPAGGPEAQAAIGATATRLDRIRQGFANEFNPANRELKSDITRTLDAADNEARIEGEQVGNSLRLEAPTPTDRAAITFIVEANGDRARLQEFLEKVQGKDDRAARAVELAQADWDRLAPIAERVNELHDNQLVYEQEHGIDPGNVEGYVRHAYDMDAMIGRGRPVLLSNPSGGAGVSTSFKKQRTFASYADAIEAGFKPRSFDVADLVQSRVTLGERLVNRQQWARSFEGVKDPLEGRPIVQPLVTQPKGTQVAPIGYVQQELMPGIRVAVHEGYKDLFNALLAPSQVRANPVGRVLLNSEAFVKHGMLMFDSFHAGRMLYKELAMGHTARGHDLGRSLLEYADADLTKAVKQGEITVQAAEWAKANRADAELLTANGLNVGRISDALYKDVVASIPFFGKTIHSFNKWVFDKLTRGAMMHSSIIELARLRKARPELGEKELAGLVASNVNTYYGNLGRQGLFKSATFQDLARIAFLAPQWVEGMARTEAGAMKQLGEVPVDLLKGKGLTVGPLAKGVGTGVVAAFVANQLINMATRGQPTWANEEHGHQLDAWIPDVTGDSPGFFLSPLSVFAELTHDAIRYYENDPHALKTVARILSNKLSPVARAEEVLRTGKDWQGRTLDDSWERIKEAGKALAPAPIPLQPLMPWQRSAPPGSLQRQLFGSAGIKIEPAPSADSQLYRLATRFKEAKGIKEPPNEPSEYRDLNNALRKQDWKGAKEAYDKLVEGKTEQTVRNHYREMTSQLYTGKRALEAEFRSHLSDSEQVLFEKAREERAELRDRFFELQAR